MNVAKSDSNQTGPKRRQRTFKQVWKPISTEAVSSEEKLEVDDSVCLQSSSSSNKDLITEANVKDGKCSITMEVDTPLVCFVKGKGGSVQKQIEEELQVKLIFPSSKEETSLVIEGNKVENLTKASERIKQVLEEAVQSRMLEYSHFISLPLALHSDLVQKLVKFQSTILGEIAEGDSGETDDSGDKSESQSISVQLEVEEKKDQVRVEIAERVVGSGSKSRILSGLGIDKSIFIKPKTFHLTVLMLKLWNKDRVATASDILQRISSKVMDALENRPISIKLEGLACMKGSPAKARVLYAPVFEVGEEGRLVRACQVIRDAFVESGLIVDKDAQQTLKLHATLMNVRHRKSERKRWNDSFDARRVFDEYGSEEWGEYPISEIHLSQRFKFDESGYYHCCSSITLPAKVPTI